MSIAELQRANETLRMQLAARDDELAARDEKLAARDEKLAARDDELAARDTRITALQAQLELLSEKLRLTARERELLAQKLKQLEALRRRHPMLHPGQETLDFGDEPAVIDPPAHVGEAPDGETSDDPIRAKHKPRKRARKPDTSHLPVEHVHHELPEEERTCPVTGKPLVPVGETLEEEIEYQPGVIKRVIHHRAVYGLGEEDAEERQGPEVVAPGPTRPLEGSTVGPRLLAWILDQKYARHLPLYRQEEILAQHGLRIPRQTMCDWVMSAAAQLQPIQEALRRRIMASKIVQTDDTSVKCQQGKGHGFINARLWTTTSPHVEGLVYDFTETRGHEHLFTMLAGLEDGVLVGDGYAGYEAFAKVRTGVVVAGCLAHAFRKFRDALTEAPLEASSAMTLIGELFEIERRADDQELSPESRKALRQSESRRRLDELDQVLKGWRDRYSESGKMGDACTYVENQHAALRVFLERPAVPIHNNACEVSIRPVAVGRKNWLFAGSVRGGCAAATIYTLVESCRRADVDPARYLADVLIRIATHPASRVDELIPAEWKRRFDSGERRAA